MPSSIGESRWVSPILPIMLCASIRWMRMGGANRLEIGIVSWVGYEGKWYPTNQRVVACPLDDSVPPTQPPSAERTWSSNSCFTLPSTSCLFVPLHLQQSMNRKQSVFLNLWKQLIWWQFWEFANAIYSWLSSLHYPSLRGMLLNRITFSHHVCSRSSSSAWPATKCPRSLRVKFVLASAFFTSLCSISFGFLARFLGWKIRNQWGEHKEQCE